MLVIAHGFFNTMVGRALRRRGWRLVEDQGYRYWSSRRFERGWPALTDDGSRAHDGGAQDRRAWIVRRAVIRKEISRGARPVIAGAGSGVRLAVTTSLQDVRRSPALTPHNSWRRETPGARGLAEIRAAGRAEQVLHVPPPTATRGRVSAIHSTASKSEFVTASPGSTKPDGSQWLITEGNRPQRGKRRGPASPARPATKPEARSRRPWTTRTPCATPAAAARRRLADHVGGRGRRAILMFPNRGLLCWATPDPVFAMAMCRQWNRWIHGFCGEHMQGQAPRLLPAASIAAGDQAGAMKEIRWAADHGFRAVCPRQFGDLRPQALRRTGNTTIRFGSDCGAAWRRLGLVVTFHVSTGRDPRAVGGNGGPSSTTSATRWRRRSSPWSR